MDREDLEFFSGGERCAAWLYRPAGDGPYPCVVLGHGFGATRAARLWAYAERFASAGIAALVFDYRHFGDSDCEPRQLLDIGRQLEDWALGAGVRALARRHRPRPGRAVGVVVWRRTRRPRCGRRRRGRRRRLPGCVYDRGLGPAGVGLAGTLRLTAAALRDAIGARRGRQPHMVPIVGAPGELAAMTSSDALPGYEAMYEGAVYRNEVAARVGLRVLTYNPAWWAPKIGCPLLVCVCEHDVITPPGPAERMAARAPRGERARYPIGHFDIYLGEWFERAVADQVEFLSRHLLGARAPAPAGAAG